jgi:hypothetical protein
MYIKENEKKIRDLELFVCEKCKFSTNKPSLWINTQ